MEDSNKLFNYKRTNYDGTFNSLFKSENINSNFLGPKFEIKESFGELNSCPLESIPSNTETNIDVNSPDDSCARWCQDQGFGPPKIYLNNGKNPYPSYATFVNKGRINSIVDSTLQEFDGTCNSDGVGPWIGCQCPSYGCNQAPDPRGGVVGVDCVDNICWIPGKPLERVACTDSTWMDENGREWVKTGWATNDGIPISEPKAVSLFGFPESPLLCRACKKGFEFCCCESQPGFVTGDKRWVPDDPGNRCHNAYQWRNTI